MKNILFVIPTMRMGGAEKSLVSLIKSLDNTRYKIDLLLFETGGELQQFIPKYVNIIDAGFVTRAMTLEMSRYFNDLLKRFKFAAAFARLCITLRSSLQSKLRMKPKFSWDIIKKYISPIEKHYDIAVGYLEGFTDFFVIDKVDADKKVGWIHSDMTGRIFSDEELEYYNRFDSLATISQVCLDAACKIFSGIDEKIRVIENIVLTEDVISNSNKSVNINWNFDCVNLVSVGRLEYAKGMDIAVRACKILADKNINLCWHIYGNGTMREEIEGYISGNNLSEKFVLEGVVQNPYPYMKEADIFVQPSRWEGKSLALDEAKILGKAIVVTNYPSVSDQIVDGKTGIIVDAEPESIASGIEKLINDSVLKNKLEVNCLNEPNNSERAVNKFYSMIEA